MIDSGCAVITGAIGNIGRAVTRQLARDGFPIFMIDIDAERLKAMEAEIGDKIVGRVVDLRKRADVDAAVAEALEIYGRIDAMVHIVGHSGFKRINDMQDVDDDVWDELLELNLRTTININRAVLPSMRTNKYGRIVNFSSAGWMGSRRPVSGARLPYMASKAAVVSMTRQIAKDHAIDGITANIVSPGLVLGEQGTRIRDMWENHMTQEQINEVLKELPMGRPASPEEMAATVSFLVSPGASYVSAQDVKVDGASN